MNLRDVGVVVVSLIVTMFFGIILTLWLLRMSGIVPSESLNILLGALA